MQKGGKTQDWEQEPWLQEASCCLPHWPVAKLEPHQLRVPLLVQKLGQKHAWQQPLALELEMHQQGTPPVHPVPPAVRLQRRPTPKMPKQDRPQRLLHTLCCAV